MERIQQLLAEADNVKASINALKRSNLTKEVKESVLSEQESYLETLRSQYAAVKAAILRDEAELKAKQAEKEKQQLEQKARQLNLYSLKTVLPEGMYDELSSEHKMIVSPYTRRDGSIGYSVDLSKLTGIITVGGHDYTCEELYEFLISKHPLFGYSNWCYVTPKNKISIYNAYKQIIEATGLLEDITLYRSLHTKVED